MRCGMGFGGCFVGGGRRGYGGWIERRRAKRRLPSCMRKSWKKPAGDVTRFESSVTGSKPSAGRAFALSLDSRGS